MRHGALSSDALRKILVFSSAVEIATGIALLVVPALVVGLLLGGEVSGLGNVIDRCFGVALLALGIACWPGRGSIDGMSSAVRAMLVYNALIALLLGTSAGLMNLTGPLLWPAIALHAVVALLLLRSWRIGGRAK